ncbi:MAG: FliM/FliN family flagellar motor switch protein [Actinomycetota bacterium]
MSDVSAGSGVGIAGVVSGLGLTAVADVTDAAGLAAATGPFLTADVIDAGGAVVGCVAVIDGPDGGDETLLDRLASVAALEVGGTVSSGEPVADGAGIAARFTTPITVAAFGDDTATSVISVTAADRRGADDGPAPDPTGEPAGAGAGVPAGAGPSVSPTDGVFAATAGGGLDKLVNVALEVSVELGRTRVTLSEVLDYDVGSVVELDRAAGAPVDVRVNDTLLAQGEVVLIDDEYAVRITAVFDPNQPHR